MKKLIFYFICLGLIGACNGQQVEQFSLLRENAFTLNPAMAGTEGFLHGTATFRKEFLQIDQSPYTGVVELDGLLADKHIGLGGYLIDDATGPTSKTGASFAFSYILPLQKRYSGNGSGASDNTLAFGAAVSIVQYRLDGSQLTPNTQGDPALVGSMASKIFPDASFGVYYRYKDVFYTGLSVPQMLGLNINYRAPDGTAAIKTVQQLNFLIGGKIAWDKDKFSLDPVAGLDWENGGPPIAQIGVRMNMLKIFFIGVNYRTIDYMVFEAGFNVKQLVFFAYAYDLNVASYRPETGSSQEVSISFKIPKPRGGEAAGTRF